MTLLKRNGALLPTAVNTQTKLFIYVKTEPHGGTRATLWLPMDTWVSPPPSLPAGRHGKRPALFPGAQFHSGLGPLPLQGPRMLIQWPQVIQARNLKTWRGPRRQSPPQTLILWRTQVMASGNNSGMPRAPRGCGVHLGQAGREEQLCERKSWPLCSDSGSDGLGAR